MTLTTVTEECLNCRHFRNDPQYLEQALKGLNCLSSGHASVRKDDGLCLVRDQYVSADFRCDSYAGIDPAAPDED